MSTTHSSFDQFCISHKTISPQAAAAPGNEVRSEWLPASPLLATNPGDATASLGEGWGARAPSAPPPPPGYTPMGWGVHARWCVVGVLGRPPLVIQSFHESDLWRLALAGPVCWNGLPDYLKSPDLSYDCFKLKAFLFCVYQAVLCYFDILETLT